MLCLSLFSSEEGVDRRMLSQKHCIVQLIESGANGVLAGSRVFLKINRGDDTSSWAALNFFFKGG